MGARSTQNTLKRIECKMGELALRGHQLAIKLIE
jgi:hypothetical protein